MARTTTQIGVNPVLFWLSAAAVIGGIGAVIWFAIPGVDARHRLVSPSGKVVLDLGEVCANAVCTRVAVVETTAADGAKLRRGCPIALQQTIPVLLKVDPRWTADETGVEIDFSGADGEGGRLTLDFTRDCTLAP
ncbi:MAG: hypothetical protein ACOVO5_10715 [Devosia sp.]|jgi:hypothetical protein|uniref:hypothetical protein n=1 Tax=Devosia sp. TaxID=1871048 RepID=UPI0037BE8FA9